VEVPARVFHLSGGHCHSLALSEGGHVFSWGDGSGGKLGHGSEASQSLPKRVEALVPDRVRQVSAGRSHSLAVLVDGRCFSWGDGELVALGNGRQERCLVPTAISSLGPAAIEQASAGEEHSALLSTTGEVFVVGVADERCALSFAEDHMPLDALAVVSHPIVELAAGIRHTALRRNDGEVFALDHGLESPEEEIATEEGGGAALAAAETAAELLLTDEILLEGMSLLELDFGYLEDADPLG